MTDRTRLLAVLVLLVASRADAAEPMRRLSGTVPRALASMAAAGAAPADLRLESITVVLGLRARRRLEALIAAQQDPRSPRFRRWLDATELADRFGARRVDYERVRGWLVDHGFRVVRDSPFRLSLVVAGTAAEAEKALAAPIRLFRHGGRTYHGPSAEPALPESIAGSVRGILGLDDLPKFRPVANLGRAGAALGPADFAAAYGVTPLWTAGLSGAGSSIAVVARSNFRDSDVLAFAQRFMPSPQIHVAHQLVDETDDPGILQPRAEELEVLIDAEWAAALAPGAQVNVVISSAGGDIQDSLDKAVRDRAGDFISISFSLCEADSPAIASDLFDALYALANAQGQTVLVAAGDGGATECVPDNFKRSVNALAASPHAVAVGGTSFTLGSDGTVGTTLDEVVWNDDTGAGGGGESVRFARPPYQLLAGLGDRRGRALPDVALAASPLAPGYVIVARGANSIVGGTSAATPALASALALVSERLRKTAGTGSLGQLLPALYRLGSEQVRGLRTPVFRDVHTGNNAYGGGVGYDAGPGFDLASGWGVPLIDALADALDAPGLCQPEVGCLVPALGPRRHACAGEWLVERNWPVGAGLPQVHQSCRDGDPQCDADGLVDHRCTMNVAFCLNVVDSRPSMLDRQRSPVCAPRGASSVRLLAPRVSRFDPYAAANRAALLGAFDALPRRPRRLRTACTATVPVVVPVSPETSPQVTALRAQVKAAWGATVARVRLSCTGS